MFRRKDRAEQSSFWIPTSELPTTPANAFYRRLDRALRESGFGDAVRALCEPFYESDRSRGGRPGIDGRSISTVFFIRPLRLRGRCTPLDLESTLGVSGTARSARVVRRILDHMTGASP